MTELEYYRPDTLQEAIELLARGVPLAGGTGITPNRRSLDAVIDLRNLGLDGVKEEAGFIRIGAMTTLQQVIDSDADLPDALRKACRLEMGRNMRNAATIGGLVMSAGTRSPILTALLALDSRVVSEPGTREFSLGNLLSEGRKQQEPMILTSLAFRSPVSFAYDQVSRSPVDLPIVSVATARWVDPDSFGLALGGWGDVPVRLLPDQALGDAVEAQAAASQAYAEASDQWAGAAYRQDVAGVLARRLTLEVVA
jgi:putative selenate reductase FAD-binding subunit